MKHNRDYIGDSYRVKIRERCYICDELTYPKDWKIIPFCKGIVCKNCNS